MAKKKILVVLGSGGHTEQMTRLLKQLGNRYDYSYVVSNEDKLSEKKILFKGKIYRTFLIEGVNESKSIFFYRVIRSFLSGLFIVIKSKADVIISAGPGITIPIIFFGKLFGKKTIFIETWSRVYSKSDTGKYISKYTDLMFVQWSEMIKLYPEAKFVGRLG